MSKKEVEGVDNVGRRTWDKSEYAERARERLKREEEEELGVPKRVPPGGLQVSVRAPLKARDYQVDLTSRLGRTQVVNPNLPGTAQPGYYCDICDCVVKDSANYLDHINGKKHTRALGMSQRAERATVDQVKNRFEELKRQRERSSTRDLSEEMAARLARAKGEEEYEKEAKRMKKRAKDPLPESEVDPMLTMMGLPGGFGSSKK